MGYLVQSVQGKVYTVEYMGRGLQTYQCYVVYVNIRHDIEPGLIVLHLESSSSKKLFFLSFFA